MTLSPSANVSVESDWEKLVAGKRVVCDYRGNRKVEILFDSGLPTLHFMWQTVFTIRIPEGAKIPKHLLAHVENSGRGAERHQYVFATYPEHVNHRYFCNFRRYGWCWSCDQHHGYGSSCVYANAWDGGLPATTPEQVVRETLIAAYHQNPEGVPRELLLSRDALELLPRMLEDAIDNISEFAEIPLQYREQHGGESTYYL